MVTAFGKSSDIVLQTLAQLRMRNMRHRIASSHSTRQAADFWGRQKRFTTHRPGREFVGVPRSEGRESGE